MSYVLFGNFSWYLAHNLEQQYAEFQSALPGLLSIAEKWYYKPKVQFFDGFEGIKHMYESTLLHIWPLYAFMNLANADPQVIKRINEKYIPQRINKKIQAKALISEWSNNKDIYSIVNWDLKSKAFTNYKVVSDKKFQLENQITLVGWDKVLILNFNSEELNGVIIQSKSYYNTMLNMFNFIRSKTI